MRKSNSIYRKIELRLKDSQSYLSQTVVTRIDFVYCQMVLLMENKRIDNLANCGVYFRGKMNSISRRRRESSRYDEISNYVIPPTAKTPASWKTHSFPFTGLLQMVKAIIHACHCRWLLVKEGRMNSGELPSLTMLSVDCEISQRSKSKQSSSCSSRGKQKQVEAIWIRVYRRYLL